MTIWKYSFLITDKAQQRQIPENSTILHVDMQGNFLCMWCLVDPNEQEKSRVFRVVGTGHQVQAWQHIGTAMNGQFVRHLFEV